MLTIPAEFSSRNHPRVAQLGYENTGEKSLAYARELLGLESFADTDILDVGCGFRFAMTLVNRDIPVKSYTGVELTEPLVDYLNKELRDDKRFSFHYWNVHNSLFNATGIPMYMFDCFPSPKNFDVIWAWSVFTHLNPYDAAQMLKLMRRHIRPKTQLFFSAFIDDKIKYEDRENNLVYAYFSRSYLSELVAGAGWKVRIFRPPNLEAWVQSVFVCDPV
jgi:SAM-dependent methyltransferase